MDNESPLDWLNRLDVKPDDPVYYPAKVGVGQLSWIQARAQANLIRNYREKGLRAALLTYSEELLDSLAQSATDGVSSLESAQAAADFIEKVALRENLNTLPFHAAF